MPRLIRRALITVCQASRSPIAAGGAIASGGTSSMPSRRQLCDIDGHKSQGGGLLGKLIYAASAVGASEGATEPEFERISWWDAVS